MPIKTSRSSNEAYVPEILIQDKCLQYKPSQYKDIKSNQASPRSCDHIHSLVVHQHYYNIDGCSTGNPGQVQGYTCINMNIYLRYRTIIITFYGLSAQSSYKNDLAAPPTKLKVGTPTGSVSEDHLVLHGCSIVFLEP